MEPDSRNRALDRFRGLTVFCMVFVNLPGSWSHQYEFLQHASWTGLRPADVIFPTFLWILGYSLYLFQKQKATTLQFPWIRFFGILFMGLFLNGFPHWSWENFRIPGVLQRIAIVYGLLYLLTHPKWKNKEIPLFVLFFISLLYSFFLHSFRSETGSGWVFSWKSEPDPANNPASLLDQIILGNHIWKEAKTYDPEGILSTTNALLSAAFGYIFARSWEDRKISTSFFSKTQIGLVCLGILLHFTCIAWNKSLWTLSFVFTTSGLAGIGYQLSQFQFLRKLSTLDLYGKHALFLFFVSGLVARTKMYAHLRKETFLWLQSGGFNPWQASLGFTIFFLFLFTAFLSVYSGIWRILTIRLQATFRLSSKVDR